MEWTNAKVVSLIKEIEARPVLWNIYNPLYKNRSKKQDAIDELVPLFGCRETEIYRKWKIVLAQYRRERNKMLSTKGFKPKWFAYEHLIFLSPFKGDDNDPLTIECKIQENQSIAGNSESSDDDNSTSPTKLLKGSKRQRSYNKMDSESSVVSVLNNLSRRLECNASRDDTDIFVEGVAAKLRKIKDESLKLMVQRDIENLLYDALIGSGHYATTTITYT